MRPLHYVEYPPGSTASDVALTYSCFTVRAIPSPDFVHRVWPDGCVSLVFVCIGAESPVARLLGVCTRATEVPLMDGARYWSIRFRPESGARWIGVSASSLRDQNVDARALLGDDVMRVGHDIARFPDAEDVVRLLDAYVLSRASALIHDAVVRAAVGAIVRDDGKSPVASVARDVGTSVRSLQRRFVREVGLTPKEFASIRRGRGALKRVVFGGAPEAEGWSGLAMDAGFADQAHMTREFTRLTRFAPRALRSRLGEIEHGEILD